MSDDDHPAKPMSMHLIMRNTGSPACVVGSGCDGRSYYLATGPTGPVWREFLYKRGLNSPPVLEQLPDGVFDLKALDLQALPIEQVGADE